MVLTAHRLTDFCRTVLPHLPPPVVVVWVAHLLVPMFFEREPGSACRICPEDQKGVSHR